MLQKAEALAEELGDDKKRLHVRSILGLYYILKGGDPQLGWKYLESCMEHPEIIQDVELMVPIGFDLCASCHSFRRLSENKPCCSHDHQLD